MKSLLHPASVTVTMSLQEAEDLTVICSMISGQPSSSPRRTTDKLALALKAAGVSSFYTLNQLPRYSGAHGSVAFLEEVQR